MNYRNLLLCLLLFSSLTTNAQGIFRTVCQGNEARLDSLLQYDSVQVLDQRGRNLVHWAVGCRQEKMLRLLVEKGVDPNQEDYQGKTALFVAAAYDNETFFDLLLNYQEDNVWVERYGTALLERAVLNKSTTFVKKLTAFKVDVNGKNERGSTPLEIAKRLKATEIVALLLSAGADETLVRTITPKGEYLGEEPPGLEAKLFAPNFISTEESEFGLVFNTAGTECYFGVDVSGKSETRFIQLVDGEWTQPVTIFRHEQYGYNDPSLSNDESRLYFISSRAMDGVGEPKDIDIWYAERTPQGWSEPINAGPNINTDGNEYYISFTNEGTMYFSSNGKLPKEERGNDYDIYYSKVIDGEFQKPVVLSQAINSEAYEADVFIAPDESYIIFCSTRDNGYGQGDLYVSFRQSDGRWTKAVNMGEAINTPLYEYCPFVSQDGKYLFYTSNQDIYWIGTDILTTIKESLSTAK